MFKSVVSLWRNLFRARQVDQALDEEMEATLASLAAEREREGLSPDEARRRAFIELGGVDQVKEQVREVRVGHLLADFAQDTAYALRLLRRAPGFTVVAVLTLAIGIGATTTVFSWVRTTLTEPLAGVADQRRLVVVDSRDATGHLGNTLSSPDWLFYRGATRTLSGLAASSQVHATLSVGTHSERALGALVSEDYFRVLGVTPAVGRPFAPEDAAGGASPVIILSDGLWRRSFAADRDILGRTVTVEGTPFTVVGVTPPGFVGDFPGLALSFWTPLSQQPALFPAANPTDRASRWLLLRGRLHAGVSVAAAQAEFDAMARRIERDDPAGNRGRTPVLFPLWRSPQGSAPVLRPALGVLGGVTALVLLLTWANVANLLVVRGLGRQQELALRLSLGASRWRIVRQLMAETLVLTVLGGLAGLLLAATAVNVLTAFVPSVGIPVHLAVGLDMRSLVFAGAATVVCALIVGAFPALAAIRQGIARTLAAGSPRATGGRGSHLRQALAVAQVALSMVLLTGAGLFVRSLVNADSRGSTGFDGDRVLLASLDFPRGYDPQTISQRHARLLASVQALPGVEAVSLARQVPLSPFGRSRSVLDVPGYQSPTGERSTASYNVVAPGYFSTLRIPLVAGRDFSEADIPGAPLGIVVNETMAQRFWGGRNPIGAPVTILDGRAATVIGVAKNIHYFAMNEVPEPYFYVSYRQVPSAEMRLHVRAAGDPAPVAAGVRGAAARLDANLAAGAIERMTDYIRFAFIVQRLGGSVLGFFGLLALALAALGLYGVAAYTVSRRKRELGIRMAFGATAWDVRRLVIGQGLRLLLFGLPIGILGAIGLGLAARSQLFGVAPTDPASMLGAAGVLAAVLLVAIAVPAIRATRMDPAVVLKVE